MEATGNKSAGGGGGRTASGRTENRAGSAGGATRNSSIDSMKTVYRFITANVKLQRNIVSISFSICSNSTSLPFSALPEVQRGEEGGGGGGGLSISRPASNSSHSNGGVGLPPSRSAASSASNSRPQSARARSSDSGSGGGRNGRSGTHNFTTQKTTKLLLLKNYHSFHPRRVHLPGRFQRLHQPLHHPEQRSPRQRSRSGRRGGGRRGRRGCARGGGGGRCGGEGHQGRGAEAAVAAGGSDIAPK